MFVQAEEQGVLVQILYFYKNTYIKVKNTNNICTLRIAALGYSKVPYLTRITESPKNEPWILCKVRYDSPSQNTMYIFQPSSKYPEN